MNVGQGEIEHIETGSRTVVVEIPVANQQFTVGGPLSDDAIVRKEGAQVRLEDLTVGDVVRVGWKKTGSGHVIELIEVLSSSSNPRSKRKTDDVTPSMVVGAPRRHVVGKGETLLDPWIPPEGMELIIPSQWILPEIKMDGIVINLAELRLFYFMKKQDRVKTFPIGIGVREANTPVGTFRTGEKTVKPTRFIPAALWEKYGVKTIPPGPENPLGDYWIGLGNSRYGIHGTDIPWSVGRLVTRGCIRLYPEDMEHLFKMVKPGTPVKIIYEPVKIGFLSGRTYVAVHKDIYGRIRDMVNYGYRRLEETGLADRVDLYRFLQALTRQDGMPQDITSEKASKAGDASGFLKGTSTP